MRTTKKVKETTNYKLFTFIDGNRSRNLAHVKKLTKSMKAKYLLAPIIVNEDYEIIDGQHRFLAAKELGYPIRYIIEEGYGLAEVQMYNTTSRKWSPIDYLDSYCDYGVTDYLFIRKFMEVNPDYGINPTLIILTNLGDSGASLQEFKEGKIKLNDVETAMDRAQKVRDFKPYFKRYNTGRFVRLIIRLLKTDKYDHERMVKKLELRPNDLDKCGNDNEYLNALEDVYNYYSKEKTSFKYL